MTTNQGQPPAQPQYQPPAGVYPPGPPTGPITSHPPRSGIGWLPLILGAILLMLIAFLIGVGVTNMLKNNTVGTANTKTDPATVLSAPTCGTDEHAFKLILNGDAAQLWDGSNWVKASASIKATTRFNTDTGAAGDIVFNSTGPTITKILGWQLVTDAKGNATYTVTRHTPTSPSALVSVPGTGQGWNYGAGTPFTLCAG